MDVRTLLPRASEPVYPSRDRRYWRSWWNANSQYCYTDEDIALLNRIKSEYQQLSDDAKPFALTTITDWRGWWNCASPQALTIGGTESASFTLPSREAKDSKAHPLWHYADNMARQIANWQSDRAKNQHPDLMNDPVMLVFTELREWFFSQLSSRECKIDVLDEIARRQSYIKSLIHLIPHFGPDRLRLNEIQHSLTDAARTLRACVANKELPQLLSEIIISGKSLETSLGTYLHFLLVDEEVSDNFSSDYLEGRQRNCQLSPVCKIYRAVQQPSTTIADTSLVKYQDINPFYQLVKVSEDSDVARVQMKIREPLSAAVKFASFVNASDKKNYLEALAALEALMTVRKTMERFHHIQSRLGTYMFALNYLDKATALTTHYIRLIDKSRNLIKSLIKSADNGLNTILGSTDAKKCDRYFEKNLRALETRVAKGTTVNAQLDNFCSSAVEAMNKYQLEMKKLVSSVNSGEASREIEIAMRELNEQMNYLNTILPGLLGEQVILISKTEQRADRMITCEVTPADSESCDVKELTVEPPAAGAQDETPAFDSARWNISSDDTENTPVFYYHLFKGETLAGTLSFHGKLTQKRLDPITQEPIFVFTYTHENEQLGTAEFYGQAGFCVSKDRLRHNLVRTTGLLSHFHLDKEGMDAERDICRVLPPSLLSSILQTAGSSALLGVFRGGTNAAAARLTAPGITRQVLANLGYIGCVFTFKFGNYYSQYSDPDKSLTPLDAAYQAACRAAYETGQTAIVTISLSAISAIVEKAGEYIKKQQWPRMGEGVKKLGTLARYGYYLWQNTGNMRDPQDLARGAALTTASFAASTATEYVTEKSVGYVIGKS